MMYHCDVTETVHGSIHLLRYTQKNYCSLDVYYFGVRKKISGYCFGGFFFITVLITISVVRQKTYFKMETQHRRQSTSRLHSSGFFFIFPR